MRRPLALRAEIVQRASTSPCRRTARHMRLTNARAVSGFSGETSQFARSSRVARRPPVSSLPRNSGIAGRTMSPESSIQFPRGRMRVSRGAGIASVTITRVMHLEAASAASSLASLPAGARFRRTELETGLRHRRARRRTAGHAPLPVPLGGAAGLCGRSGVAQRPHESSGSPGIPGLGRPRHLPPVPPGSHRRGHAGPADNARRKRPSVARRIGDSWRIRITMVGIGRRGQRFAKLKGGKRIRRRGAEIAEAPRRS